MPTYSEKMQSLLNKYNARASRNTLRDRMHIGASSFTTPDDGFSVTFYHARSLRHISVFTFQVVRATTTTPERYSMFFASIIQDHIQDIYPTLEELVLYPLIGMVWCMDYTHPRMPCLRNVLGQTMPIKSGRRIWSTTVAQSRTSSEQWYNPRPSRTAIALPVIPSSEPLIISVLAGANPTSVVCTNLDGHFNPDTGFTPEEVA